MERIIGRLAAATMVLAATTVAVTRAASAQASRGDRASSSSSRSFDRTTDARDLTAGLSIGVYSLAAAGVSISGPEVDGAFETKLGEGAGLVAGYGFNRTFSVFASIDLAKQATAQGVAPAGTYGLAHLEIGGRANLPMGGARTTPYISAGIGNRALAAKVTDEESGLSGDFSMSGQIYVLGAGIQHFMSPHMALDAGVEFATGSFSHFDDPGGPYERQVNSSITTRLRVGVNWRP
jgi:opacity protein-like surface antigen